MSYLTFQRFVPKSNEGKDFSGLEDAIKSTSLYYTEGNRASCIFVRGSTISSYDSRIQKVHPHSDIDLVIVSSRPHRLVNQYREVIKIGNYEIEMPIDVTHINQDKLNVEVSDLGAKSVTSLFDFVQDCHPLDKTENYFHYRKKALKSFLRLGLGYYEDVSFVTPSGAMKAINQGKLLINPLRWWSIEYAFAKSGTADKNIARYYNDIDRMLHSEFDRSGKHDDENMYAIPDNFSVNIPLVFLKMQYFSEKIIGRFYSNPIFSLNDLQKIRNKLKSLVIGILQHKSDMDILFKGI